MLEPLTATLLASRQFAAHVPYPALKTVKSAANAAFPHDFFTPQPRRAKGKEKALSEDFGGECMSEDASRAMRTFTRSSVDAQLRTLGMSPRHRIRRVAHRRHTTLPTQGSSFSGCPPQWPHLTQRRHMSSGSDSPGPSTLPVDYEAAKQTVLHYASGSRGITADTAWESYEVLPDRRRLKIPQDALIDFTSRLLNDIESPTIEERQQSVWDLWAPRLSDLLESTSAELPPRSSREFRHRCLELRFRVLDGKVDLHTVTPAIHDLVKQVDDKKDRTYLFQTWTSVIRSLHWHRNVKTSVLFLFNNWEHVGAYLTSDAWTRETKSTSLVPRDPLDLSVIAFRATAYDITSRLENATPYLASIQGDWDPLQKKTVGEFLIAALCHFDMAEDAVNVLEMLQEQSVNVQTLLQLEVVKALVKDDKFERANTIFTGLKEQSGREIHFKGYIQVGLYLYAHQGDTSRAEEYFAFIVREGWTTKEDVNMIMHAYAVRGDIERTISLFNEFFPYAPGGRRKPNKYHYTTVILAHGRHGDYDGIKEWMARMIVAGIEPDDHVYSIIMQSYAMRGDAASMADMLAQLREAGKTPSRHAYTTLIALLASRRDSMAAEDLYARAIRDGIVPDKRMVTALMNAHVEAGSWAGVVRAFDYMKSCQIRGIRLGLEVYNTLLKAYVRIGAPFRIVSRLFQRLDEVGVRPDAYSFALLIQSACDSGLMKVAEDIFAEMRRLVDDWESNLHINVFVLTILMGGYLRKGLKHRARSVFAYMKVNKIQPSAVTYGTIIRTYARDSTDAGLKAASEFLTSLLSGSNREKWTQIPGKEKLGLDHVYGPLMIAYSWRADPAETERYYNEMLEQGGEPSITSLTALLDAYRRMGDVEKVKSLWPQIVEVGLRESGLNIMLKDSEPRGVPSVLRNTGNALCIPLSIIMDAMSAAGQHVGIARVWHELRDAGFAFDAHNWNHLTVALVRAGEPERAFEIIERVILPYQRKLKKSYSPDRDSDLSSPLLSYEEEDLPPAPNDSPYNSRTKRYTRVRLFTKKSEPGRELENPDDFAHPLHILHQISPLWNIWRPHSVTMTLLAEVLDHLRRGRLIQPYIPGQSPELDPAAAPERRKQAHEILARIEENSPKTVDLVRQWRFVQAGKAAKYFSRKFEKLQEESDDQYRRRGELDY
ncbi:hypothetical protein CERSUDRAFT_111078 [Gelatoporia subvermispora B]|uniref:Pentacotripeptide-repeat region of PRORP domain-containing protein n=1 Tax=Ceriporiopsis subvermispora (strain B) TaxID=914234 RepID=M2QTU9_CERS8|nr:hypothetical protein CERSUDRAFT_111078 [Gelatoporia subvermispora B]